MSDETFSPSQEQVNLNLAQRKSTQIAAKSAEKAASIAAKSADSTNTLFAKATARTEALTSAFGIPASENAFLLLNPTATPEELAKFRDTLTLETSLKKQERDALVLGFSKQALATQNRNPLEIGQDTAAVLASAGLSIATELPYGIVNSLSTGGKVNDDILSPDISFLAPESYQEDLAAMEKAKDIPSLDAVTALLSDDGRAMSQRLSSAVEGTKDFLSTDIYKAEQVVDSLATQERDAQYAAEVGENASLGDRLSGTATQAGRAIEYYLENPSRIGFSAVESLPFMITGSVFSKAAQKTFVAGLTAREGAEKAVEYLATREGKKAIASVGTKSNIAYNAAAEGFTNGVTVQAAVMDATPEQLREGSEAYRYLVDSEGYSHKRAQAKLAQEAGLIATGLTGLFAGTASFITGAGAFEGNLFNLDSTFGKNLTSLFDSNKKLVNNALTRVAGQSVLAGGSETVEEAIQGGGGVLSENIAKRVTIKDDQDLLEGVGEAVGAGAAIGFGTGAGISAVRSVTKEVIDSKGLKSLAFGKASIEELIKKTKETTVAKTVERARIIKENDTKAYDTMVDENAEAYDSHDAFNLLQESAPDASTATPEEIATHNSEAAKHLANYKQEIEEALIKTNEMPDITDKERIARLRGIREIYKQVQALEEQLDGAISQQFVVDKEVLDDIKNIDEDGIDRVLGSAAHSGDGITIKTLTDIEKSGKGSDSQKTRLKNRIATQRATADIKSDPKYINEVIDQELTGGQDSTGRSWKGFAKHLTDLQQEISGSSQQRATASLKALKTFLVNRKLRASRVSELVGLLRTAEKDGLSAEQIIADPAIAKELQELDLEYKFNKGEESNPTGSNAMEKIYRTLSKTIGVGTLTVREAEALYNDKYSDAAPVVEEAPAQDTSPTPPPLTEAPVGDTGGRTGGAATESSDNVATTDDSAKIAELRKDLKFVQSTGEANAIQEQIADLQAKGLGNQLKQQNQPTEIEAPAPKLSPKKQELADAKAALASDQKVLATREAALAAGGMTAGKEEKLKQAIDRADDAVVRGELRVARAEKDLEAKPKKAAAVSGTETSTAVEENTKALLDEANKNVAEIKDRIAAHEEKANSSDEIPELGDEVAYEKPTVAKTLPKDYVEVTKRENISLADMRDLDYEMLILAEAVAELYKAAYDEEIAAELGQVFNYDRAAELLEIAHTESAPLSKKESDLAKFRQEYVRVDKLRVTSHADTEVYANFLRDLLAKMGLDINLHVTTMEDGLKRSHTTNGEPGWNGFAATVVNNNYTIAINTSKRDAGEMGVIEVVSHELGHILEWHLFNNMKPEEQAEIFAAYDKWLVKTNKVSKDFKGASHHFTKSTRAYFYSQSELQKESGPIDEDYYYYITSFAEWHADQVSKWATSTKEPLSVLEKYFANVARFMREAYKSFRALANGKEYAMPSIGEYKADPTIQKYLDKAFAGNMNTALIKNAKYRVNRSRGFVDKKDKEFNKDAPKSTALQDKMAEEVVPETGTPLERLKAKEGYHDGKLKKTFYRNVQEIKKIINTGFISLKDIPGRKLAQTLNKMDLEGASVETIEGLFNNVSAQLASLRAYTQKAAKAILTGTFDDSRINEMYRLSDKLSSNYLRTYPDLFNELRNKDSKLSIEVYSDISRAEGKLLDHLLAFEQAFKQMLLHGQNADKENNVPFVASTLNLARTKQKSEYFNNDIFKLFLKDDGNGLKTDPANYLDDNMVSQMAVTGFTWLASRGLNSLNMPASAMNALMGRQKDMAPTPAMEALFQKAGMITGQTNYPLGQKVLRGLGLEEKTSIDEAKSTKMEAAIGDAILITLNQMSLIKYKRIPVSDIIALKASDADADTTAAIDLAQHGVDTEIDTPTGTENLKTLVFVRVATEEVYNEESRNTTEEPIQLLKDAGLTLEEGLGLLEAIFGEDKRTAKSLLEAPTEVNDKVKNSLLMRATKVAARIMGKMQERPDKIRQDNMPIYSAFSRSSNGLPFGLANILGYTNDIENTVTKEQRLSVKAKNDDIIRDIRIFDVLLKVVDEGRDKNPDLFHRLVQLSNGRTTNETGSVNPEASKLHRRMTGSANHIDTIHTDGTDSAAIDSLLYTAAEYLGLISKQTKSKEEAIEAMRLALTGNVKFAAAIKAIQAVQAAPDTKFTAKQEQAVIEASQEGGEGMASLDALIALASYLTALETQESFTTAMYHGADATNSGPAISAVTLMATGANASDIRGLLEKAGFYFDNTTDALDWASKPGNWDIYEHVAVDTGNAAESLNDELSIMGMSDLTSDEVRNISDMIFTARRLAQGSQITKDEVIFIKDMTPVDKFLFDHIKKMVNRNDKALQGNNALVANRMIEKLNIISEGADILTGAYLTSENGKDKVEKAARNLFKFPVISSNYGAFLGSAARDFAAEIIEGMFSELSKAMAAGTVTLETRERLAQIEVALNSIIYPGQGKKLILDEENMSSFTLKSSERTRLLEHLTLVKGTPLKTALTESLGGIFDKRKSFNSRASEAALLFKTAFDEKVRLAGRTLSKKEKLQIIKDLSYMVPILETPLAGLEDKSSIGFDEGMLLISINDRTIETKDDAYKNVTRISSKGNGGGLKDGKYDEVKSVTSHGRKITVDTIGVSGGVSANIQIDAAVMLMLQDKFDVLNLFDEIGVKLRDAGKTTEEINKIIFEMFKTYDPQQAMVEALERTLAGRDRFIKEQKATIAEDMKAENKDVTDEAILAAQDAWEQTYSENYGKELKAQRFYSKKEDPGTLTDVVKTKDAYKKRAANDAKARIKLLSDVQAVVHYGNEVYNTKEIPEDTSKLEDAFIAEEIAITEKDLDESRDEAKYSSETKFDPFESDSTYETFTGKTQPNDVDNLNSVEVFEELTKVGPVRDSAEHLAHLRRIMSDIIAPTLKKVKMRIRTEGDKIMGAYLPDKNTIYISNASTNPQDTIHMSAAGVYAHELGHVVTLLPIDQDTPSSRELVKLYKWVKANGGVDGGEITPHAFLKRPEDESNRVEWEAAEAQFNHVFRNSDISRKNRTDPLSGHEFKSIRSEFLHEFAMAGVFNEQFRKHLLTLTPPRGKLWQGETIPAKITHFFKEMMHLFDEMFINNRLRPTAAQKLERIVERLVNVEDKNKSKLAETFQRKANFDKKAQVAINKIIIEPLLKLASTRIIAESKYQAVRAGSGIIANIPYIKAVDFVRAVARSRKIAGKSSLSLLDSFLRELSGPAPDIIKYHTMVSTVNKNVDQAGKTIQEQITKEVLNAFLKDKLTEDENFSLSRVFMRGDMSTLYNEYTSNEIVEMLNSNNKAVDKEIENIIAELLSKTEGLDNNIKKVEYFRIMAKSLASVMMRGESTTFMTPTNANNIAHLNHTREDMDHVMADEVLKPIIAKLITLNAMKIADPRDKAALQRVYKREYARDSSIENGIDFLNGTHTAFKALAISENGVLAGQEALSMQGYVRDIYDENVDIKQGTLADEEHYIALGYRRLGSPIPTDRTALATSSDIAKPIYLYVNDSHRTTDRESGAVTMRQQASKGTDLIAVSSQQEEIDAGRAGKQHGDLILQKRMAQMDKFFAGTEPAGNTLDKPADSDSNFLIPIPDATGRISGWRYMMNETTKRTVLKRKDHFEKMIGLMESANSVNPIAKGLNMRIVGYIVDDFKAADLKSVDQFVFIGEKSKDPRLKEIWQMLPSYMREEFRKEFGKKGFFINEVLVEEMFGRKKPSFADWLENNRELEMLERTFMTGMGDLYIKTLNSMGVKNAYNFTRKGGQGWAEVVRLAKYTVVVKLGAVLAANFTSNNIVLWTAGLNAREIVMYQIEAVRHANSYLADLGKVATLRTTLKTKENALTKAGLTATNKVRLNEEIKKINAEINETFTLLDRNPVRDIHDTGMYSTIAEEIQLGNQQDEWTEKIKDYAKPLTDLVNSKIKGAANEAYVTASSVTGTFFKNATQQSDFIARYALHKHNMKKGAHLTDKDEIKAHTLKSLQHVKAVFIAYDTMTHKGIQYMNDNGWILFSKYAIRIQAQILNLAVNHPARMASFFLTAGMLNVDLPFITGSAFFNNAWYLTNNPFDILAATTQTVYTAGVKDAAAVIFEAVD